MHSNNEMGLAIHRCFYCCEPKNEIVMSKNLGNCKVNKELNESHDKVVNMIPCEDCQERMKQGIILIGVDYDKSPPGWETVTDTMPTPYRTGHFIVVKDQFIEDNIKDSDMKDKVLKLRWTFIPKEIAEQLHQMYDSSDTEAVEEEEGNQP